VVAAVGGPDTGEDGLASKGAQSAGGDGILVDGRRRYRERCGPGFAMASAAARRVWRLISEKILD
jgi:hypothetical protein